MDSCVRRQAHDYGRHATTSSDADDSLTAGYQVYRTRPYQSRNRSHHRSGFPRHKKHGGFRDVGGFE